MEGYSDASINNCCDSEDILSTKIDALVERLKKAQRPVIYAGNGIRISGGQKELLNLAEKLGISVATCWDSIDLIQSDNDFYVGRGGIMGDRPGNFAVQNSDLLLAIGNRLNIYQVGYQLESWAREAYVIDVDIDPLELQKKTIRVDLPICYDAKKFMEQLLEKVEAEAEGLKKQYRQWIDQCVRWKEKYPVVEKRHYEMDTPVNIYAFIDMFSKRLPEGMITVVANGSASVVGSAAYYIKNGQRFIMNCAISSMGYDLPAAVGACEANKKQPIVCIAGDGSIMMNLQELQTIVTNKLPIKIVLINNEGYQQIRLTQTNLFNKHFVGIGPESEDLGFPDFGKISNAFGIPYLKCDSKATMSNAVDWIINQDSYCMLEVVCSTDQIFEPKSATKRLENGRLYSPPLEDLAPFLPREELAENMYINLINEE